MQNRFIFLSFLSYNYEDDGFITQMKKRNHEYFLSKF